MAQGHVVTITNITTGVVAVPGISGTLINPGQSQEVTIATDTLEQSGLATMAAAGLINYVVADDADVPAAMQIPTSADLAAGIVDHVATHETGGGDVLTDIPAAATLAGGVVTVTNMAAHVVSTANPHTVTVAQLAYNTKWTMSTGASLWREDADAIQTNGAGTIGDATETPITVDYIKLYDAINVEFVPFATSSSGTDVTANGQFATDTNNAGDAVYIGGAIKFPEVSINITGAGAGQTYTGDAYAWEYWNGAAWAALTIGWDGTDATANDGLQPFQQNGAISFVPPVTWASSTIDGQAAFWIRAIVTIAANLNAVGNSAGAPFNYVVPDDGFITPFGGIIQNIRVIDGATTVHGAQTINFILHCYSNGANSGLLTWAINKRQDSFTITPMAVASSSVMGVVVIGDDGGAGNDPSGVVIEMTVTATA